MTDFQKVTQSLQSLMVKVNNMAFMKMKKVKVEVTLILSEDYECTDEVITAQMIDALYRGNMLLAYRNEYVAKIKVKKIEDHLEGV